MMKSLFITLWLAMALIAQTTVDLKDINGNTVTVTIPANPRLLINPTIAARIKDPDDSGSGYSPLLTKNPPAQYVLEAWGALHDVMNTESAGTNGNKYLHETAMFAALGFYMDNYASFSGDHRQCTGGKLDGSVSDLVTLSNGVQRHDCYKWFAVDAVKNWHIKRHDSGSCWIAGDLCGWDTTSYDGLQYYGENVANIAFAYTIVKSFLTSDERTMFIANQINGTLPISPSHPTMCESRIPDQPSLQGVMTFTTNSQYDCTALFDTSAPHTPFTASWSGTDPLPNDLAGKWIFYHEKPGESGAFTSQTQVVITNPGYTASQYQCWDDSGVRFTATSTSFAVGLSTLNFATPKTGRCITQLENLSINGSFGKVETVNPATGQFTFQGCGYGRNQESYLYILKDPNLNTCGFTFNNSHYGDSPTYTGASASTTLVNAITPNATTMQFASVVGFPTSFPFYMKIGNDILSEHIKVTNIVGTTVTATRGLWGDIPRAWNAGQAVIYRYTGQTTSPIAHENRNLTKQEGTLFQAFAYADESAYARDILQQAVNFYYTASVVAGKYFGILNTSGLSYGISRVLHYLDPIVQVMYTGTGGTLDYRQEWMKRNMGYLYLYWTTSWDQRRWPILGQTPGNCNSLTGTAEVNCLEPAIHLQEFYRGSNEAKWAWKFVQDSNLITQATLASNQRTLQAILLYTDGSETGVDWRTTLPTHFVEQGSNPSDATTNLSFAISKTGWNDNGTFLYVGLPDGIGDKWIDPMMSHYVIGNAYDWFMGVQTDIPYAWIDMGHANNNYDNAIWKQTTIHIGKPGKDNREFQLNGTSPDPTTTADFSQEIDKKLIDTSVPGGGRYFYVRANSTNGLDASRSGFTVTRRYRHIAHFKPDSGNDAIVVFDDVGTNNPAMIQSFMLYNNNGQSNTYVPGKVEGWTDLSTNGRQVVSSSYNGKKLVTDIIRAGQSAADSYISNLSVYRSGSTFNFCYFCSPSHPARVLAGGNAWEYTAPMGATVTLSGTSPAAYFWIDPADGILRGAPKTGGSSLSNCTGPIQCSGTPISDWPDGNMVRVAKYSSTAAKCPGSFGGTNGVEDYHCRPYPASEGVYLSTTYSGTSADYLVTHQIKPIATSPDPVSEITTINSNYAGVYIGGSDPKVAVFAKGGTGVYSETSFTTNHSGNASYLVAGLSPGIYNAKIGSTIVASATISGGDGAMFWVGPSGAYTVTQSGQLPTLQITTSTLPDGTQNSAYSPVQLTASGGSTPYSWTVLSGTLPTGMLVGSTGLVSGTPTGTGISTFTVRVTDALASTADRQLSITINTTVTPPAITNAGVPDGTVGVVYPSTQFLCNNCPGASWDISSGTLPNGLSLSSGGLLSGTPTVANTFNFTVRVTITGGTTATKQYIAIIQAAPVLPPLNLRVIPLAQALVLKIFLVPYNTSCTMTVTPPTGEPIVQISTSGPPTREFYVPSLNPETAYPISADCGSAYLGYTDTITTLPNLAETMDIPIAVPPGGTQSTAADEVTIKWGYNTTLGGTPVSTSCNATGCKATIPGITRRNLLFTQFVYRASGQNIKTGEVLITPIQ